MKQENIDKVFNYLKETNKCVTKDTLRRKVDLSRWAINTACRILRKEKKIGFYYRKWWGIV